MGPRQLLVDGRGGTFYGILLCNLSPPKVQWNEVLIEKDGEQDRDYFDMLPNEIFDYMMENFMEPKTVFLMGVLNRRMRALSSAVIERHREVLKQEKFYDRRDFDWACDAVFPHVVFRDNDKYLAIDFLKQFPFGLPERSSLYHQRSTNTTERLKLALLWYLCEKDQNTITALSNFLPKWNSWRDLDLLEAIKQTVLMWVEKMPKRPRKPHREDCITIFAIINAIGDYLKQNILYCSLMNVEIVMLLDLLESLSYCKDEKIALTAELLIGAQNLITHDATRVGSRYVKDILLRHPSVK